MAKKNVLTAKQQEIYNFTREQILTRGFAPSVREIAEHFEISSPNGVMCHLRALEKKGYIQRLPNKSRAIELTKKSRKRTEEQSGLPFAGRIAAGPLSEAIEQSETINFAEFFPKEGHLVLEVTGDSMIEAQISDGDYVVVKRQKGAHSGDIVVALTEDGEATLKYWFPEKNRIRLQPANKTMKPIYTKMATVEGIVVGVVRKL
ncbi:MAG: transcriptional repressor LexA [Pirellulaceae bacterium]|nr:transcriptional repressor LexA [Pirellulaceae bacterium]